MKYLVVLTDGAGDRPIPELEGKTPLQVAELRNINELAKHSEIGTVQTIPEGMSPGSDAANLSVMGTYKGNYQSFFFKNINIWKF